MKELKTNQVRHKIECMIDFDDIVAFVEKQTGTKIEGHVEKISTYQYGTAKELEFTIAAIKEDRLKELVYDADKVE